MLVAIIFSALLVTGVAIWLGTIQSSQSEIADYSTDSTVSISDIDTRTIGDLTAQDIDKVCPLVRAPVCGVDGVVYDNKCSAKAATSYHIPLHVFTKQGDACDPADMSWIPVPE